MKVVLSLLLFVFSSASSNAALLMFEPDSSGVVNSVSNCSCIFGSPTCTSTPLLASPFCTCTSVAATDIADDSDSARSSLSVSWWNSDKLTICCQSTTSSSAKQVLDNLIDFSYTEKLSLDHCEGLVSSTEQYLTVYGLQEVSIQTDVSANNPTQFLSMTDTDFALTNKRSREYRDHHIAFIDVSLLTGNVEMKSWSIWAYPEEAESSLLQASFNRAPLPIASTLEGTLMYTLIYD